MKYSYNPNNPYYGTAQTNWYTNAWKSKSILPDNRDKKIILEPKYHLRPDKLSFDLYNNPAYYWVFWLRNQDILTDIIWSFTAGKTIVIPSAEYIKEILG